MTKKEKRKYQVREAECYNKDCFVPFAGNGIKICRLWEMGQCPDKYNKPVEKNQIVQVTCSCGFKGKIEDLLIDDEEHRRFFCPNCRLTGGLEFITNNEKP